MTTPHTRARHRTGGHGGAARALATVMGAAALIATAGCSSSKSLENAGTPAGIEETTTVVTTPPSASTATTDAPAGTSTSATPTTSSSTTSTVPAGDPMVLRADGIGRFTLGDESAGVVDGIGAFLGAPVSDTYTEYPVADGMGQYTTVEGETGFVAPVGRSTCWSVGFCAEFGGATRGSMSFTGWTYHDDATAALHSAGGVTLQTRLSDAPSIVADEGGCYSVGSGTVDGIRLVLESTGDPFSSFDDSGNYVLGTPAPDDVTVAWMETGHVPLFLYGDC